MNFVRTFNPVLLLGDRLGLTLYRLFVEAYLRGTYDQERSLYQKFIKYFRREKRVHTAENFISLIRSIQDSGLDIANPVHANPAEFTLLEGSHRCAIAMQLGITEVPYIVRFEDSRVDERVFTKIFTSQELALLHAKRDHYIAQCSREDALRCNIRITMRNHQRSFQTPFSSKTKIPALRTYQGLESLGILGKRPSEARLRIYELSRHLNTSMDALEIGCNVGFFSLCLSKYVRSMTAFDLDQNYIQIARMVQTYYDIRNCTFLSSEVSAFDKNGTFDLVISTAIHGWSGLSFASYLYLVDSWLKPGGVLLFESHELDVEKDWPAKKRALLNRYRLLDSGIIDDTDKSLYCSEIREFLILKKNSVDL